MLKYSSAIVFSRISNLRSRSSDLFFSLNNNTFNIIITPRQAQRSAVFITAVQLCGG